MKRLVILAALIVAISGPAYAQFSGGGGGGSSTITVGTTPTLGITSGNIIGSTGNLAVDSAIAFANVATLSGSQAFTGIPSFNNTSGIKFAPSGGQPFELTSRNLATIPVPIFYPTTANQVLAFDLSPSGTATDAGYGKAWMDICNTDIIVNGASALQCIHAGSGTNQQFGVAEYNSGTMPNFFIGRLNGDTGVFTSSITQIGADGSLRFPLAASDAGQTDATFCRRTADGAMYFGSGTLGVCLGTSSARFKHDIGPLNAGLDQIMKLEAVRYYLNEDHGDPNKLFYGFTAEQGGKALPDLAGVDSDGRPNTFDYLGVVPVLVKAVQQQQAEIEQLKSRWCLGKICW